MPELDAWLLDLFEDPQDDLVLYFISKDGQRLRLRHTFPVTFYALGQDSDLRALWRFLAAQSPRPNLRREKRSDVFTRQDIVGTLPQQIQRVETFLIDNLRRGVQLGEYMARTELMEYPLKAVRELVVNAVAHRDYSIQGDGIRLYLFSDRLEITSPGGLPGPVTVDNIVDERFSRNSAIVQILSDMGFIALKKIKPLPFRFLKFLSKRKHKLFILF